MLAAIIHLKLATHLMSGWVANSMPVPMPAAVIALAFDAHIASPVEISIHDINRRDGWSTIVVERDGSYDAPMKKKIAHVFRCTTEAEHVIARKTLAMLAAVSERYAGHQIELVSGYRVRRGESMTSPHRDARAIDFRVEGVPLPEIRDWLWRTYTEVGIGWYPFDHFIHMDTRPTMNDTSWTDMGTRYYYNPPWSITARAPQPTVPRGPGV